MAGKWRKEKEEKEEAQTGLKPVPRPKKRRKLGRAPRAAIYKPAGEPLKDLRQIPLEPDELEALRLADAEGLTQEQGAREMGISRSTFQRILSGARRRVALALVEGAALNLRINSTVDKEAGAAHTDQGQPGLE